MLSSPQDYFITPILDRFLLYAPLHRLAVIMTLEEVGYLQDAQQLGKVQADYSISEIIQRLSEPVTIPQVIQGTVKVPLFLGLIPTRGCNLGCQYCDFNAPKSRSTVMQPEVARKGIDAYLRLLKAENQTEGEIQFFGGEPFYHNHLAEFVLAYAREKAAKYGIGLKFNVTTNGLIPEKRAAWVADQFDAVVLSLDGARFQDIQRPLVTGLGSYQYVHRTAEIISDGKADLIIRVCVTDQSVEHLLALGHELASSYILNAVCFEPLTESKLSRTNSLSPPSPVNFARQFLLAEDLLSSYGIETVVSGTDIHSLQASFCPVGKDALLLSPDGNINACYLMESDWARAELDLKFGTLSPKSDEFIFDLEKLEKIRELARSPRQLCDTCLCRFHCAGGCYVNHSAIRQASQYDAVCIRTRLVTIGKLLRAIGCKELYQSWLENLI